MMKNFFLALAVLILASAAKAQNKNDSKKSDDLLAELSGKVCQCIDSIPYSISKDAIHFRVKSCIDDAAELTKMGHKLMNVGLSSRPNQRRDHRCKRQQRFGRVQEILLRNGKLPHGQLQSA
jgi:hypothetical protein